MSGNALRISFWRFEALEARPALGKVYPVNAKNTGITTAGTKPLNGSTGATRMPTTRPAMAPMILYATIRSAVMDGGFPASSISRLVRPYDIQGVRRVIDETTLPANGKMSRSRALVLSCS